MILVLILVLMVRAGGGLCKISCHLDSAIKLAEKKDERDLMKISQRKAK